VTRPVADVLRGGQALLLDFDGPVCRVFAGHPNVAVATMLRRYLEGVGIELPAEFATNRDPLKLLQWVGKTHRQHIHPVEDLLIEGETTAAASSTPTAGAAEVVRDAYGAGWPIAIVSNNAASAIERYLDIHGLADYLTAVAGRPYGEPERMKPRPDMVQVAAERLGVPIASCVLVGDSPSDIEAARAAGAIPVGYVKAPDRRASLYDAGPAALIDDMRDLLGVWVAA